MHTNSTKLPNKELNYEGLVLNGFLMSFVTFIICPLLMIASFAFCESEGLAVTFTVLLVCVIFTLLNGFFIQQPNQSRVITFFGVYKGTTRKVGFFWINPFMSRAKVSLRIRNLDVAPIKVNDKMGNPVMIGMVLVWRVNDTYRAVFDVESGETFGKPGDFQRSSALNAFVTIQSDAALREVTGRFAYDSDEGDSEALTLRSSSSEINEMLERTLNDRLSMAGVEVVEARINYLAYAPEIAAVMLRRQQAAAIISAREKIVEGAVTMVSMALNEIGEQGIVTLSNEQKATIVGNLLMVLCSDEPAQPVINTDK